MPRKPRAEAPAKPFSVALSPAERARVLEAAHANRQSLSQFSRDALLIAADDCLESFLPKKRPLSATL